MEEWVFEDLAYSPNPDDPDDDQVTLIRRRE